MIALYEFGGLDESEVGSFLDHLVECEYCFNQVYSLEEVAKAFRKHREAERLILARRALVSRQRRGLGALAGQRWLNWVAVAACCVLLAGSIFVIVRLIGSHSNRQAAGVVEPSAGSVAEVTPSGFDDLQIPKAPYQRPNPAVILRGPGRTFDRAMAAYQANEFNQAIEQLATLSELDPDVAADAKFYLGVSLLMVGRSREAVIPLRRAAELQDGLDRETVFYYLGLAYLKANQPSQAVPALQFVVQSGGKYGPAAEGLLQRALSATR